ncbi:hypothetical protein VTN00DRAFT_10161 [Thermoascus crustaceus]|uniref:uncharacterized protein n=1 Tax=Thermoascus crustaceus TaxID=5088 RepID=UPI0037428E92
MPPSKGHGTGRRNPSVLVTDSRDQRQQYHPPPRRSTASTRFITVDNVLQYASDVPSMQQRHPTPPPSQGPPGGVAALRARGPRSRIMGTGGAVTGIGTAGSVGGTVSRLAAQPRLPPRTTKVSEKLVLLPETEREAEEEEEIEEEEEEFVDEELVRRLAEERNEDPETVRRQLERQKAIQKKKQADFDIDNNIAPLLAEEEALRRRRVPPEKAKSYAERLPKARRAAEKLARVTAYCTAQAYRMSSTAAFVKEWHGARTKLYDDCLYTAYHLPLLPGRDGYRVRSSPVVKGAGGRDVLAEEIERNERRDHHEEFFTESEEHSVGRAAAPERRGESRDGSESENPDGGLTSPAHGHGHGQDVSGGGGEGQVREDGARGDAEAVATDSISSGADSQKDRPNDNFPASDQQPPQPQPPPARIPPNVFAVAEMFVFSYGVVVFWNFTERQEKDILADLAFCSSTPTPTGTPSLPLTTMPLLEEDFETEEFHFEYSTEISRPRVYNDMITLRSGDHMIKLAISHGIAQSTKLCFFEEVMARQMAEAKDIPRRLAVTGKLGMKREEVFRILGRLFKSRVEVNLSSNVLDVPNFFWESEPTLYPLYIAVREYLEIKPRIQVLNERCRVFLDLAEILSDSIADNKMSHQTWIIIVLICISILVTASEVFLRFGLLSARTGNKNNDGISSTGSTSYIAWLLNGGKSSSAMASCVCPAIGGNLPGGNATGTGTGLW